ncbi:MAG: Fumarate hydratase class II [Candidatus Bathyarchaeota archaeon BA2]|nr:MAG: Fumarate hydratase class II [Candidatus Bathyarchaeota archaeon BA2]
MSKLLRGGRITSVRKDVAKFTSSIKSDQRLLKPVIEINEAHVAMMMERKIIEWSNGVKLLQALSEVKPKMKLKSSLEDVHMAVEEEVTKKVGSEIGGNLHIAKSRNDQVATAIRMKLRENLVNLMTSMVGLQEALTKLAEEHVRTVVPGYTHLQPAQPVTFAHYLLSYVDELERDFQRLEEAYKRVNLCPMGAGALATSSFPINREMVAELLGFSEVLENSIDAVSSRDFVLETMAVLTIIAVGISRLVEDLIVWSSPDFGVIELPDRFSSTSSIMPQKKNPDLLEVIRARMSHALGNFVTSVTTMKALPSSYNLDFQEITPRLWETLENITSSLDVLSKLVANLKVSKNVFSKPHLSFLASTELANMLVRKYKVPFRTAHKIVGLLIRFLTEHKLVLDDVTPELLQKVAQDSSGISLNINMEDIREATDPLKIVKRHNVRGGPSPTEVKRMLKIRKKWTAQARSNLLEREHKMKEAEDKLQSVVQSYSTSDKASIVKLKSSKG